MIQPASLTLPLLSIGTFFFFVLFLLYWRPHMQCVVSASIAICLCCQIFRFATCLLFGNKSIVFWKDQQIFHFYFARDFASRLVELFMMFASITILLPLAFFLLTATWVSHAKCTLPWSSSMLITCSISSQFAHFLFSHRYFRAIKFSIIVISFKISAILFPCLKE